MTFTTLFTILVTIVLIPLLSTIPLLVWAQLFLGNWRKIRKYDHYSIIAVMLGIGVFAIVANVVWQLDVLKIILVSAVLGIATEIAGNFIWQQVTGTKLFDYYRGNIFRYSSWWMLPFWGLAGLVIYILWVFYFGNEITIDFDVIKSMVFFGSAFALITAVVLQLSNIMARFVKRLRSYVMRTTVISAFVWGGLVGGLIEHGQLDKLPFFIIISVLAFFLEGLLGMVIKFIFGEHFWVYHRLPVFGGSTSYLIMYYWGPASLAFLVVFGYLV